jgi:8-oxo-dGTP diphosphatase
MLRKGVGKVWKVLPPGVRLRLVRMSQRKFTVSVGAIIVNEDREVLLLNHVLRPLSGWGLPGGFINRGEQPEDAIRREMREEIGIELGDLKMFRVRTIRSHVEILFTATPVGSPQVMSREILDLGWFTLDTVPEGFSIAQRFIIQKVLNPEI